MGHQGFAHPSVFVGAGELRRLRDQLGPTGAETILQATDHLAEGPLPFRQPALRGQAACQMFRGVAQGPRRLLAVLG
jgi:hypothetical protein